VRTRVEHLTESDWRLFAVMRLRALTDSLGEDNPQYRAEVAFTAAQFVAWLGSRPVGLIGAQQESAERVYLYSLWLAPEARGRGLAKALVRTALEWARSRNARTVTLRVATDNTVARAIYQSLGFTATESDALRDEVAMALRVS